MRTSEPSFQSKLFLHAVSTPLSSILINLELALEHLAHSQHSFLLREALVSARHLQALTTSTQYQAFNILQALHEVIIMFKRPYATHVFLSSLKIPDTGMLIGNKYHFQESLLCVLKNAAQAYEDHATNKLIYLTAHIDEGQLVLRVIDGGHGISWWARVVFKYPYFDTLKKRPGLGLRFVKSIIETHFGGKMMISPVLHKGTTVTLKIPLLPQPYSHNP
ncbi:MAG TPA: HAMP domain-containing sensor histidine kinase [Vitreimonas sp.]|nr:HAMP domain-containing sensor histidine kinase [Vitreimonas sp.]